MSFILLLAALVLTVTAGAYICYRIVFVVSKHTPEKLFAMPDTEQYRPYKAQTAKMFQNALSIPYEEVWTTGFDGVKLFAKYYAATPGAPVQIMFHGYQSAAERDFCGGMPFALSQGFNVLLVDQRAHGKSGGKCLTFGVKERFDCLAWIDYAIDRFGADTKIALYGMSMGASTILMAAGLKLPENVRCILADCGYTSPADIIKSVMRNQHYPVWLFYPLVRLGAILFGGFDPEEASAAKALAQSTVPVLLIHGEDDRFVPCEMSRKNYRQCSSARKRLVTFPLAAHGTSYLLDEKRYLNEILDFLHSCQIS